MPRAVEEADGVEAGSEKPWPSGNLIRGSICNRQLFSIISWVAGAVQPGIQYTRVFVCTLQQCILQHRGNQSSITCSSRHSCLKRRKSATSILWMSRSKVSDFTEVFRTIKDKPLTIVLELLSGFASFIAWREAVRARTNRDQYWEAFRKASFLR